MASISVETPYYSGMVEALVLPDAIYDLIIGNIKGARNPDNPDPNWTTNASVKTNKTELENIKEEEETSKSEEYIKCISKEKLTELQKQDSSIQKILQKGKKNFSFYKDNGIIFCKDNRRDIDTGKVVPVILRERLMT